MADGSRLICQGNAFALYAQVALFDAERSDSYPVWEAGAEKAFFSSGGVVVATELDGHIDIAVYANGAPDGEHVTASGTICVGRRGLLVGNVVAAMVYPVPWPEGLTRVDVCTDPAELPARVTFVLTALGRPPQGLHGAAFRARTWVAHLFGSHRRLDAPEWTEPGRFSAL